MNFATLVTLIDQSAILRDVPERTLDEIGVGAAIVLTLLGMGLHWYSPNRRMELEERTKDGKVTADEARRQIRFLDWCARLVLLVGVAVLIGVLFDLGS